MDSQSPLVCIQFLISHQFSGHQRFLSHRAQGRNISRGDPTLRVQCVFFDVAQLHVAYNRNYVLAASIQDTFNILALLQLHPTRHTLPAMYSDAELVILLLLVAAASCLFGATMGVVGTCYTLTKLGIATARTLPSTPANESGDLLQSDDLQLVPCFLMPHGKAPHRKDNCGGSKNPPKWFASKPLLPFVNFATCCKTA